MSPREGVLQNIAAPFMTWLHGLLPKVAGDRYSYEMNLVQAHQEDYRALMDHAQALLRDPSIRFAYIHWACRMRLLSTTVGRNGFHVEDRISTI